MSSRLISYTLGVIPAKAGIPLWCRVRAEGSWIPAFAGVTPLVERMAV